MSSHFLNLREKFNMLKGKILNDCIVVDPRVCSGKPVIRGTRIMVKNILGMVAGGYTVEDIRNAYPELSRESIQSALEYAAMVVDEQQVVNA